MSISQAKSDPKVRAILHHYRPIDVLHPVVADMYRDRKFERTFWQCLGHDLNVIRGRSQNLDDGEITAAQKAFLILMDERESGLPAIQLYVDKLMGLEAAPEPQSNQILATALEVRDYFISRMYTANVLPSPKLSSQEPTLPSNYGIRSSENPQDSISQHDNNNRELCLPDGSETSQASELGLPVRESKELSVRQRLDYSVAIADARDDIDKLFVLYKRAKPDFEATPLKSLERTKAAKFLRDTAENCISCLTPKRQPGGGFTAINTRRYLNKHGLTLEELKSVLEQAREAAEQGSGGKKRRFDYNWDNVPEAPATMRSPSSHTVRASRDPVPRTTQWRPKMRRDATPSRTNKEDSESPQKRARRINQRERTPHKVLPVDARRGRRRFFPHPAEVPAKPTFNHYEMGTGDCYRPKYS